MAGKDEAADLFTVPCRHLLGILKKITGTLDTLCPALNFNRTRPEYKSQTTLLIIFKSDIPVALNIN